MAVSSAQITVGTAAVQITTAESDAVFSSSLTLKNTGTTDVFLGPAGVTTATGYSLAAGGTFSADLSNGEQLFAVAAVSGTVHVLRTGV